jgi:outer membrane protein
MKRVLTLGLIAISMFGFTNSSKAQSKIGYISADEIIVLMPEAARVDTELNKYQAALYEAAREKQDALNEAVQKFYKDSSTMTAQLKEVKRKDLQEKIQELSGEEQKIQNQFDQKRQELSAPIQRKLKAAIDEVAKENGYAYIFPKESLIVMPSSEDIGSLVRKKLGLSGTASPSAPRPSAPVRKK